VSTLSELQTDLTKKLILDAALQLLETGAVGALTIRDVARCARISERTVFRHFAARDDLLDAVALQMMRTLALPPPPETLAELRTYPRSLYGAFEARSALVRAALRTDLSPRLRDAQARDRWTAARRVVDAHAPKAPESARKIAATNIRFYLAASAWDYYRATFGFSFEETVACAETAIADALRGVKRS